MRNRGMAGNGHLLIDGIVLGCTLLLPGQVHRLEQ
jgi:hypothetical protein